MKRQYGKITQRIVALMLGVLLTLGTVAQAADNIAVGDIAGDGFALGDSLTFTLTTSTPTLFKVAFLTSDFSALSNNDVLPVGTSVDFLIYLNNVADVDIDDVSIQDTLLGFSYVPGTIRVLNTTTCIAVGCTLGEEQTIYDDARVTVPLSDTPNNDAASFAGTTVEVGNEITAGNAVQNAVANTVLAVVFTATIL